MAVLAATAGGTLNHPTILCGSYDNKVLHLLFSSNLTLELEQLLCVSPACRSSYQMGGSPMHFHRGLHRGVYGLLQVAEPTLTRLRCVLLPGVCHAAWAAPWRL